ETTKPGAPRDAPGHRSTTALHHQRARPDEIRELLALLGLKQRVDPPEGADHLSLDPLQTLHALVGGGFHLRFVEALARHGVGERGEGSTVVDLTLRALGLEIA